MSKQQAKKIGRVAIPFDIINAFKIEAAKRSTLNNSVTIMQLVEEALRAAMKGWK